jgi:molecular chaperone DnaK (HSP70)
MTPGERIGRKTFIGVDFGNLTTKLAISSNDGRGDPVPVVLPGISRMAFQGCGTCTSVIPSLIHYARDGQVLVGMQVVDQGLLGDEGTVRWMAHYTSLNSPVRFRQWGKLHSYRDAASGFLSTVIMRIGEIYQVSGAELIVAVPAGSQGHYSTWLPDLHAGEVISRVRIIEQPEAVSCAFPGEIREDNTFMIIDFGGSRLEVLVAARCSESGREGYRVVARAGDDIGGQVLDRLLLRLVRDRFSGHPPVDRALEEALLQECEKAKEELSMRESADVRWEGKRAVRVTRHDFEEILAREGLYRVFSSTVEHALHNASMRGYGEDSVTSVILTGGSMVVPSFMRMVKHRFPRSRLWPDRPLDAVSRGATAWPARSPPGDRVTQDYAIRIWNPEKGVFELRTIIRKGCAVPSRGPVARFRIQATYDGQTRLGVPLYLMAPRGSEPGIKMQKRELRFESTGMIRMEDDAYTSGKDSGQLWVNEGEIPLIPADPPAMRGEPRFELCFSITASRDLLVSARDLRTGRQVLNNVRAGVLR